MRIIDAFTGRVVRVGDTVRLPEAGKSYTLTAIIDRFLKATAIVRVHERGKEDRDASWPLTVRFTHPSFFLERVAFVES